jgi:peroxiredoxin
VSGDSPFSHEAWARELGLGFPLLSDWNWEAARAFGVLREEMFDWYRPLNTRAAFIVDQDRIVRYARVPDSPSDIADAREVLAEARALSA